MSFPIYDTDQVISVEQRTWSMRRILAQLASGGLQIRLFYNTMHNVVYCKIRASQMRLMKEASRIGLRLQLDESALAEYCRKGRPDLNWSPLVLPEKSIATSLPPYKYMTCAYTMNEDNTATHPSLKGLYKKWLVQQLAKSDALESDVTPFHREAVEGEATARSSIVERAMGAKGGYVTAADGDICTQVLGDNGVEIPQSTDDEGFTLIQHSSLFRMADRLKLIHSIVNNNTSGGCYLNTNVLLKHNCILAFRALQDPVNLMTVQKDWISMLQFPWNQNTDVAKDYFGERIGLYFAWLGHYTSWLILASIAGIVAWSFVQAGNNDPNNFLMPYFAGFMAIWGTVFLEYWKRTEVRLAMEWGMDDFKDEEQDRPEFSGIRARSPITGQEVLFFPQHLRLRRVLKSYGIVFASLSIVIGTLALMLFIRVVLRKLPVVTAYSAEISSLLIAIQIECLNYMFSNVALALNDNENHRTDTEYEDALINKAFVFQFLNSFACLFYISFLKPFMLADRCDPKYCFYELQATLGTIFMSRLFLSCFFKLIWPMYTYGYKLSAVQRIDVQEDEDSAIAARNEISEVEQMFLQPEFDALMGTFNDYADMVAQFGYMTMFISAFPLCTVLALTNNYVQLRVDAWRLCQVVQRPDPMSAEKIGSWQHVMELIGIISVFTNAGLISFTGQFAVGYTWALRVWIFFLMSAFIICVKWGFMSLIPDTPNDVFIQAKRKDYILEKVVHNKSDFTDVFNVASLRVRPNFKLKIGDDDPL